MQSNLNFIEPKPDGASQDLITLLSYLRGQEDWTTARSITGIFRWNDRKIRKLANESDGHILSGPGCPGYKHILNAAPDEITQVYNRLKHQSTAMLKRAISIQNAYHKAPYKK